MIDFSSLELLSFFETEPEVPLGEIAVLRYSVITSSGIGMRFTIDSPLRCVHVTLAKDGVVFAELGTEGVVKVSAFGKGRDEKLECVVETATLVGKVVISWKATPHVSSHLLDRGGGLNPI